MLIINILLHVRQAQIRAAPSIFWGALSVKNLVASSGGPIMDTQYGEARVASNSLCTYVLG